MHRHGRLWPSLTSWSHLWNSARAAAKGKRRRPDVAAFLLDLEPALVRLQRELITREYRHGAYHMFLVADPKPRVISAAPFRDRIVHHALTGILEPLWEKRFTNASFACRKGYGAHAALDRATAGAGRYRYVLSGDIRQYFASVDHDILRGQLQRVIKCEPTLQLARIIIEASGRNPVATSTAGETPAKGLPLGNQTSQFFANVYLDPLDQCITRGWPRGECLYIRYVDDFLLFCDDKGILQDALSAIKDLIGQLRLQLHPAKTRIHSTSDGVTFLGWRLFPGHRRLVSDNVVRFRRRLKAKLEAYADGEISRATLQQSVQSWIAHAAHGNTWRLREAVFGDNPLPVRTDLEVGRTAATEPGSILQNLLPPDVDWSSIL